MYSYAVPAPSRIFYLKHMFPNPLVLFTYPPPLYSLKYRTIFVMTSVVWRFLFEESQTLSWFMHAHVYKTANTCNNASTGANEMHNFLWLKHIFMQPLCGIPSSTKQFKHKFSNLVNFVWSEQPPVINHQQERIILSLTRSTYLL